MNLSTKDIYSAVKYLTNKVEGDYSCDNVRKNLKNKCKVVKKETSYYFDSEDVWNNYLMKDEKLIKAIIHRRIPDIYNLLQYRYEDLDKSKNIWSWTEY